MKVASFSEPQREDAGRQQEFQASRPFPTDDALEELKSQSTFSCVLCALEDLDDEDWE